MVVYKCVRCLKEFSKKHNYEIHTHRKYPCEEKNNSILMQNDVNNCIKMEFKNSKKHYCMVCSKGYTRRDNLTKHLKKGCDLVLGMKKEMEELRKGQEEFNEIKHKMSELESKFNNNNSIIHSPASSSSSVVNNNNKNCQNIQEQNIQNQNNNINITLVNFGHEDFDNLTKSEILKIISSRYGALRNYVEFTHLNDRLPEQQNILISNLRSNECKVVENDRWVTRDVNEVLEEIINSGVSNIENYLEEHNIQLDEEKMEKLRDLLNKMSEEDEKAFFKKHKLELKRLLYNNKDKVTVK